MKTKIVEAGQGQNWGKFLICQFTEEEWNHKTAVPSDEPDDLLMGIPRPSVLAARGWHPRHIIIFDLETLEGSAFNPGGSAHADLDKHKIWVCPMFEPFLEWLYDHLYRDLAGIEDIPDYVDLPGAPFAMAGYRREGGEPCPNCNGEGGWRNGIEGMRRWDPARRRSVTVKGGEQVVCPVCKGGKVLAISEV